MKLDLYINEALFLHPQEKDTLAGLMANIRTELSSTDDIQDDIIRDYIQLILDYCKRFYARQFKEMTAGSSDILARFQQVLIDYYEKGRQLTDGLPSVKFCASELCLSPGYFGDIVRSALGESPKDYIRSFVIHRAKNQILSGQSISQVAEDLGFEYSQHFTRMFKNVTGQTPSEFFAENSAKRLSTKGAQESGRVERLAEQRKK
ncbi:MAG: AraC family transcriptional regulator [Prevotella sp.]|nr:AraC family transcriptional regulator [Prevotella sp.]MBQ8702733.1 AraC family transcriptional regulator [Prevotella sp.]